MDRLKTADKNTPTRWREVS